MRASVRVFLWQHIFSIYEKSQMLIINCRELAETCFLTDFKRQRC